MNYYKVLNNQIHTIGDYSIVPIRYQDRFEIMKWRNEQIYHLRQKDFLTEDCQEKYFTKVIQNLFKTEYPDQLLFSFLKNNNCIGYGGLVKINWIDKNAEISFLMNTNLEKNHFEEYWLLFLELIEQVGFSDIFLNKIYTYAFDLRPQLYPILLKANYSEESRLKAHCFFQEKFIDVLIHSKFNDKV
jgi:hypothetical protein